MKVGLLPKPIRQIHMIGLLYQGASNREIAEELGVSLRTIESDLQDVRQKLNIDSTTILFRARTRHFLGKKGLFAGAPSGVRPTTAQQQELTDVGATQTLVDTELTAREHEILMLLGDATIASLPNKVLATHLGISETTLKKHLSHIYQKVRVPNRTAAALLATRLRTQIAG